MNRSLLLSLLALSLLFVLPACDVGDDDDDSSDDDDAADDDDDFADDDDSAGDDDDSAPAGTDDDDDFADDDDSAGDDDDSAPAGTDDDGDGVTVEDGDCDDTDPTIYPQAGDTYGDGIDSDCDEMDCEAASDGSTYFVACLANITWSQADGQCQAAGYDGLAKVTSGSENNFIEALAAPLYSAKYVYYWIGLTDSASEGDYLWSDGSSLGSYSNWDSGEPDGGNISNEDCMIVRNWLWHDDTCDNGRNYICDLR